jgi:UDP-N-acetylglucosamine 2-epimerase (non-hydrolysing)
MPEEINRVLTDQISTLLFTTEASAEPNLRKEGVHADRIHFTGNVMIDTLLAHRDRARALGVPAAMGLRPREYGLLTLHRPSNVDDPAVFERLMAAIGRIAEDVPILFPVHPRTRGVAGRSALAAGLAARERLKLLDPLGYLEFIGLMEQARIVLTDSGGIQEETTILGVPCLTLRENTERPVTVTHGTNRIAGTQPESIVAAWEDVRGERHRPQTPPLWDGGAAERIVDVLVRFAGH